MLVKFIRKPSGPGSMIFFSSAKQDEWKAAFRLTNRCLVYGWATKSASIKIKKSAQRSEGLSMTTR